MQATNARPPLDGGRNEKLLAARKKLKQFQNRRRSSSRSYGGENEHNSRYYQNEENLQPEHYRDRGRRYQSQNREPSRGHTENAEGRPLSECYAGYSTESLAESTASTTKATRAARARRTSGASSRHLETPEPVRVSIPLEQQEMLFRQQQHSIGAFFHDEQRSPFQRVKSELEDGEPDLTTPTKPPDGHCDRDLVQNELETSSSSSTVTWPQQQKEQDESSLFQAVSSKVTVENSGSVGVLHSADEAGVQMQRDEPNGTKIADPLYTAGDKATPVVGGAIASNANMSPPSVDQEQQHSACHAVINQQQAATQQLNLQLQQLHSHYSQLHTAYSELVHRHQQQTATGGTEETNREMEELRRQVQLHLHTMSVLVDEKTDLQSQLRQAMEIANQKHFESEELQGRLKANRDRLTMVESELESHRGTRQSMQDSVQRQAMELERLRKESAQWQARASEAQQDRSEMSAKLKVRSREVDDISKKLKDAEKQLHLKEIYIQQLTGGPGALQQQQMLTDELEQQRNVNVDLQDQLETARKSMEQWRWETEQSRERYEAYVKQLNDNVATLAGRLEQTEKEKYNLQIQCDHLEKQLAGVDGNANQAQSQETRGPSAEDLQSLKLVLSEFEQGLKAANDRTADLERQLGEKDTAVMTLTETMAERDRHIQQLTDHLNEKYQHDESAKSLLEQLHNEKATVSRAVAQNIELKKQLVELQEKFVFMSEASMDASNKLESSERQTATLKETVTQQENEIKALKEKRDQDVSSAQEQHPQNMAPMDWMERTQMEDRLRHYEVVQKHFDAELERSQREIGHLKVEKANLTQRLTVISEANQNLQMEMQRLTRELMEKEKMEGGDEIGYLRNALQAAEENYKAVVAQLEIMKTEGGNEDIKQQLLANQHELAEAQRRLQHLTTENSELHRIMEQNAEDENQNTIRVELRQALNRSTALSNDNEGLRQRVQELETQLAQEKSKDDTSTRPRGTPESDPQLASFPDPTSPRVHQHPLEISNNGDDRSSVCSEHIDQRREAVNNEAFEKMKTAMEKLQQRFAKAMNENANLSDQNQQLEHLITQLQSETETIGEYITIYQHQRKTIRERLKEREEYVARLAREKEDMQEKLLELQQLMVRLLREKGGLKPYAQSKPVYGRPPSSPPSIVPPKPRTLSQTLVDEVSGSEVSLNAVGNENAPVETVLPVSPTDPSSNAGNISPAISIDSHQQRSSSVPPIQLQTSPANENEISKALDEDDATAERILRLLTELRRPDLVNNLPPVERSLHCKYCTGRLMLL